MTHRSDPGQATVEFALALPIVVVLVLGLLQVMIVARDQIAVELAAREGARAAAVAADPAAAADTAARRSIALPIAVDTAATTTTVTVTVRSERVTGVPLIGVFIRDVTLSASVTMAREPP